ncbi:hypothetical protein EVJ58_g9500 [Rhodofomes roseus]|uniref:Cytochrome P450 n=1 Tax=Rhodofomes roseus TaxID=34475 RepID=A0A4Y9XTH8_9APHY|nr:hypothetical protein EVJ58_g9500 [Rhodofomes roseus]
MPALPSVMAIICLGLAAAVLSYVLHTPRRGSLPPGPPRVPLLGNAHQLPQSDQHLTFTKWAAQYGTNVLNDFRTIKDIDDPNRRAGDVVYVEIFTRPTIILSSAKAAIDLMDKRGAIYSDRPRFVWFHEILDGPPTLRFAGITRHGDRREARRLLLNLLHHPNDFVYQIKRYTAGIIFEVGYGHDIASLDGENLLKLTERGIRAALVGSGIGSGIVDFFPVLRYLPAWLPGMSFKYAAIKARKGVEDMEMTLYNTVNDKIVAGIARPSFAAAMIEECLREGAMTAKDKDDIKGTLGTLYQAGTDSSLTTLIVFVLVMVQYPDVFRKAQEEMIRVVGDSRLPEFDDRASLPYLECVLMEVYRCADTCHAADTDETDILCGDGAL